MDGIDYNMIISFQDFEEIILSISLCKSCKSKRPLIVNNDLSLDMGFSSKIVISCSVCSWSESFFSSKQVKKSDLYDKTGNNAKKRNSFEIKTCMVSAFKEIGKGFHPLQNFSRVSNLKGMSKPSYNDINKKLLLAYNVVATESMKNAAAVVFNKSRKNENGSGLSVSCIVR